VTTVTGKLLSPAGAEPARGSVTFALVDYDDKLIIGFDTTVTTASAAYYLTGLPA